MATPTLRAAYAKHVLSQHLVEKYNHLFGKNETSLPPAPGHESLGHDQVSPKMNQAICIVGAGSTGLSAAIMLQYLGFTNITIVEASTRIGGRAYTHKFTKGADCAHNYYDVGAMRIPKISTQTSTFSMIDFLNNNGEKVPLACYTYNDGKEPSSYEFSKDTSFDKYMSGLLTSKGFLNTESVESIGFDQAFRKFIHSIDKPDHYSTRDWLMVSPRPDGPKWKYWKTEVAETFDTSTGLFDQAFMETICDWYDFQEADLTGAKWYRIEGGMSVLTDAMYDYATKRGVTVLKQKPVTVMKDHKHSISVHFAGSDSPQEFAAVFNTTTFGCLRYMDIQGLNLSAHNLCAIRALSYDRATKVAIKFTQPWWRGLIKDGGVSGTDLCISNVVYPSWDDGSDSAYTIIVSYSWAQDATRMAALMQANDLESTDPTDPVVQLCLRDLVTLWEGTQHRQTVEGLLALYSAHHYFSWSHDPFTAGAYALFGPGQFEYMYPQFTKPLCDNKFNICGEAVSAHHAWISGAFDSAYNAIFQWLFHKGHLVKAAKLTGSPFAGGEGKNTAELDENLLLWQLALAKKEHEADGNAI